MTLKTVAIVFAVGKIFTLHFASGGTLLDFDPAKVSNFYKSAAA